MFLKKYPIFFLYFNLVTSRNESGEAFEPQIAPVGTISGTASGGWSGALAGIASFY